jgi:hypothetical protein
MDQNKIYLSLDEARIEVLKRWNNKDLKNKIETILGEKFGLIDIFSENKPLAVIWRSMLTPDNGFDFYYQSSNYIGCSIAPLEFLDDKFVTINEEKKALSQIKLNLKGKKFYIELTEYNKQEGKILRDVLLKTGEKLCDFHAELFKKNYDSLVITDISNWCKNIGSAKDYYYYYLLHFVCHGVLFESFSLDTGREEVFTQEIILPAIKKIQNEFGVKPLIVRLYPEQQNTEEDFYWFSYPKSINNDIIEYAKINNYKLIDFKN